jgi:hypothetical protein
MKSSVQSLPLALMLGLALSACQRSEAPGAAPTQAPPAEVAKATGEYALDETPQKAPEDTLTAQAKQAAADEAQRALIEQQAQAAANADGSDVKVKLGDGDNFSIQGKDKDGKPVSFEKRSGHFGAAELAVAPYPGAQPGAELGTFVRNEKSATYMDTLRSPDDALKVAAWYRSELKKLPGVKEVMDFGPAKPEGGQFMVFFEQADRQLSVTVDPAKEGGGSTVQIMHTRPNSPS